MTTDNRDLENVAKALDAGGYPHIYAATVREAIARLEAWEEWAYAVTVHLQGMVHEMESAPHPIRWARVGPADK